MKFLKLSLLTLPFFLFIVSCQKPDIKEMAVVETITGEYKLMTPAYYRESIENSSIQIRFYESPRIYELFDTNPDYFRIKEMLDENKVKSLPVRVFIENSTGSFISVKTVENASAIEIQTYNATKFIDEAPSAYKSVISNYAMLETIFDYCQAQACATGTATIDYCIPFQYVVDGCYARAHKMRQIMIEEFAIGCEKVFSYEGGSGSLAVDAGDCCVNWWYHVAPLVSVKMPGGVIEKFVVDPSMFDGPVSIAVWTAAQETVSCPGPTDFGHYEITEGKIYTPGGSTDKNYLSTNSTLLFYADLVTCD